MYNVLGCFFIGGGEVENIGYVRRFRYVDLEIQRGSKCGNGIRIVIQINGIGWRIEKLIFIFIIIQFLIKGNNDLI